jgi:hypothetical protein
MLFDCCYNNKKKEKIKVVCQYCNLSSYSNRIYVDDYDKSMTIKELKKILLDKINSEPLTITKIIYKKIHFINQKQMSDSVSLGLFNKNQIVLTFDLE